MASLAALRILQHTTRPLRAQRGGVSRLSNRLIPPTVLLSWNHRRGLATGQEKKGASGVSNGFQKKSLKEAKARDSESANDPAAEPAIPRKRQTYASLDFEPEDVSSVQQSLVTDGSSKVQNVEGPKRTGARSAKNSLSSSERKRRRMGWVGSLGLLASLVGGWIYLGWEDEAEPGIGSWIARSNKNALKMVDLFDKPIWDKLLPDPLPPGYQRPYTLILSIDDLLVSSTWDRQNGWRTAKRPGLDYFLGYLSQFYEIVIFTTQSSQTSIPIIEQLDPYGFYFIYHLFREATRTHKGVIVKDLSYLNRDLSKVIAIDTVADRYALHPDNVVVIPKWEAGKKGRGEKGEGDLGLVGLIPFLESIAIFEAPDVRPILEKYKGKDIAKEYAEVEAANKRRFLEEWEKKHKEAHGLASGGWTLSRLFGQTPAPPPVPQSWLDQRRAFAQEMYRREMEDLEKMKPELQRRKAQAQEESMKELMEGGMFGALSKMGLGPKLPSPTEQSSSAHESHSALSPTTPLPPSTAIPTPSSHGVTTSEKK